MKKVFLGIEETPEGKFCFKWIVTIKGIAIEYSLGIGNCRLPHPRKYGMIESGHLGIPKKKPNEIKVNIDSKKCRHDLMRFFHLKPTLWNEERLDVVYIKPPRLRDILYSLAQDAQAGSNTFYDFCHEFGYDIDSRKHLDIS